MKKALQIAILRGGVSLPERAAGPGPQQARPSGPRDELAELLVIDLGGSGSRFGRDLRRDVDRFRKRRVDGLGSGGRLGDRADRETQPGRRPLPQSRAKRVEDRLLEQVEL